MAFAEQMTDEVVAERNRADMGIGPYRRRLSGCLSHIPFGAPEYGLRHIL